MSDIMKWFSKCIRASEIAEMLVNENWKKEKGKVIKHRRGVNSFLYLLFECPITLHKLVLSSSL
jgi:hypothetical protein